MATSKRRSEEADALTRPGYYFYVLVVGFVHTARDWRLGFTRLFPRSPERVDDDLGHGATSNPGGLPVWGNLYAAQLPERDLNAVVHSAQSSGCTMSAIIRQKGQVKLGCENDLTQDRK